MSQFRNFSDNLKRKIKANSRKILFVCVGSSTNIADSVGPLVGSYLKQYVKDNLVLGDMKNNIQSELDLIYNYQKIKNKFVIAIDSAIVSKDLDGEIFIINKPLVMGSALNKNKGTIGDISIKIGISSLEIQDKYYIDKLAKFVSKNIIKAIY